ncbi:MAG: tRNA epoxyqueuosine(34) reductase QueG [Alphaproteobacteria bacterium]|nr:tRNA epoxyqueuosine(34) reductase QueG [Alphaproteobacteria bacterium]
MSSIKPEFPPPASGYRSRASHHIVAAGSRLTSRKEAIRNRASEMGFDAVGFTRADIEEGPGDRLTEYLRLGLHGDMAWMAETEERRRHPRALWADARSIIVVGQNYGPRTDPLKTLERWDRGNISVYARGRDYHDVLKTRLKKLARWLVETHSCEVKVFVDTAPVMEKPLAALAGVGWQGKHTNIVSRDLGSWLFLGSVFTDLDLESESGHADHCGSCRRCLDICPTDAFPAPYRLDARRCISYLTIEHKGHIPAEFRSAMGNRIYGCDDCLAVCPWNKFARRARENAYFARAELTAPRLVHLLSLDEPAFRDFFAGSAIKRTGRNRILRNVLIAAGNSGRPDLVGHVRPHLSDPSPLVRAMAVWALSRLLAGRDFELLRASQAPRETDAEVGAEWSMASERGHRISTTSDSSCM